MDLQPAPGTNASIAAIILTKNEERDLAGCLESLRGVVSEVFVVDSGSTDATVDIARSFGASVLRHEFRNYANQLNWALDNAGASADWILRIDADERLSPRLRDWLMDDLTRIHTDVAGVLLPLRIQFLGRFMRWGDSYPVWLLRLFRRGLLNPA